jgi:hypothetical protein
VDWIEILRYRLVWNTRVNLRVSWRGRMVETRMIYFSVNTRHLAACDVLFIVILLLNKPIQNSNVVPSYCVRFDLFKDGSECLLVKQCVRLGNAGRVLASSLSFCGEWTEGSVEQFRHCALGLPC